MKIIFFEVADWENHLIRKNFPNAQLVKDRLTKDNLYKYLDFEIISPFVYSQLSREVLDKLPNLKYIATRSTGFDHIDVKYCQEKGVLVSNVPDYGARTVAEHTFGLILTLAKKIYQSINQAKNFDFNHENIRGIDLSGKTLGIVGLGKIGFEVLKIARGFEMSILVFTRTQKKELQEKYQFEYVNLPTLLSNSDIVTIHVPYTKETHHLINKSNINYFKKGSYLINTSRGGVIETEAIIFGLENNILAGVGLDVLEEEKDLVEEVEILTNFYKKEIDYKTIVLNHILINHPKVVITPHNAFNTVEALQRIIQTTTQNITSFLNGHPQNLVF